MKKNIIIYLSFLALMLFISVMLQVEMDEIWEFSFSYNISKGLLPYKDINMIVGPLYSLIFSLPLLIFNNNLLAFEIIHCLLYALVFTFVYKKIGKNAIFMALLLGCSVVAFGYNIFCMMLFLIILMLLDSKVKNKDLIIGILIGMIIMVKHNIGGCLALVYFFTSKNKIKTILYTLIPIIPIMIYLFINNIFFDYIDFCYLGMGSFTKNISTDFLSIIPFAYFIYKLIKIYKTNKDVRIIYILAFQIICFPILDQFHTIIGLIPIAYYIYLYGDKKLAFYLKYFTVIGFVALLVVRPIFEFEFNTDDSYLKYQMLYRNTISDIKKYDKYINKQDGKVYLLLIDASMIRLYRNEQTTVYDLFLRGNLGSNENKYIDNFVKDCKNKKCVFILDKDYFRKKIILDQWVLEFKDYIVEHYRYLEDTPLGDRTYVNY